MGGVKEAKWEWAINNDSIILAARSMQGSNFHDSDHRLLLQSTFQQRERRGGIVRVDRRQIDVVVVDSWRTREDRARVRRRRDVRWRTE